METIAYGRRQADDAPSAVPLLNVVVCRYYRTVPASDHRIERLADHARVLTGMWTKPVPR
jgi:hypothetical protein